ncbi:unnamed protein product, partial [Mesorhabditis spiculigera]
MLLLLLLMLSDRAHAGQLREWNHVECHADEHACILLPDDFKEMKESPDFDFWKDVVRASGPECRPNNEYMIITEDDWVKEYAQRYQFCKKQDPDALTKEHCPPGEVYCHDGQSVTCMPRKYYRRCPSLGELTCHRVQGLPKAAPNCRPADQYAYATGKDPLITDTDVLCVPLGGNASSAVFSSGPVLPILILLYTLNQMA